MSVEELKKVISEKVDQLNENQLKVILEIIEAANISPEKPKFDAELFFEEAVSKYGKVLQKLAQ